MDRPTTLALDAFRVHLSNMLSTTVRHRPHQIIANERLDEVAELLATALVRTRTGKSSPLSEDRGEKFVDLPGTRSGHAPVSMEETAR